MEEIFEVNAKGDTEDMDLCDFNKDTSLSPAPPKNQRLTTPLEVHSSTPPSSKQKQPPKVELKSKT